MSQYAMTAKMKIGGLTRILSSPRLEEVIDGDRRYVSVEKREFPTKGRRKIAGRFRQDRNKEKEQKPSRRDNPGKTITQFYVLPRFP